MKVKYLTREECEKIKELNRIGMKQKDIAIQIGRSPGAVSHVINAERKGEELTFHTPNVDERPRFAEVDLGALPDNLLFHHTPYAIP